MRDRFDYSDIIDTDYPRIGKAVANHPPMAIGDRAKIFASFAALKGYEDSLANKQLEVEEEVNHLEVLHEEFFDV